MTSEERWRPAVGWEGLYEVSDFGQVRSLDRLVHRTDGRVHRNRGRSLRQQPKGLYRGVTMYRGGGEKPTQAYVHRLVLEAFVGPCPGGMECRHHDNNRDNNRLANLSWGTPKENAQDRIANGSVPRGEACVFARITEAQAREIKALLAAGVARSRIVSLTGASRQAVGSIARGTTWRWLEAA